MTRWAMNYFTASSLRITASMLQLQLRQVTNRKHHGFKSQGLKEVGEKDTQLEFCLCFTLPYRKAVEGFAYRLFAIIQVDFNVCIHTHTLTREQIQARTHKHLHTITYTHKCKRNRNHTHTSTPTARGYEGDSDKAYQHKQTEHVHE